MEQGGTIEARCLSRVRWRLMPVVALLYFVAYLDRNNVGFAAAGLRRDIGLTASAFGFGAGLFFIGYFLLEIPSNAGMHRYGARRWIARILVSWGVCATALAAVNTAWLFDVIRFLLGAAEAGFFPGILFYFTLWFPRRERARMLGLFVLAQPVANAIGAPISGLLLRLDGALGLHGWQWLFIVEGVPAILLGMLAPLLLTDRPASAGWLPDDERRWLTTALAREAAAAGEAAAPRFRDGLRDRRFVVYAGLNFGMVCGVYGFGLWLPTIVHRLSGAGALGTGALVFVPYAVAALVVVPWSRRAARTGLIAGHASVSLVTASAGLLGAGLALGASPWLSMGLLCVASAGIYAAIGPFLSLPSNAATGAAAAAGLAVMNAIGNLGGFFAPWMVGLLKDWTGGNEAALLFLSLCLFAAGVGVFGYARRRPEGRLGSMPGGLAREAA